jgi:hypothetical protein
METPSDTAPALGPALLGRMLLAAAELPRQSSTDALITQAVLQAEPRTFQSHEFRVGLAACLAHARYPDDEEMQARDTAQWHALLADTLGERLLSAPGLTAEQRRANLSFFLFRPEFPLELLTACGGHLTQVAALEAQLALQTFPPEQVAPIARFPKALVPRFPDLTAIEPPVDAQALALLIPHVLSPGHAARMLQALADDVFATSLEDSPVKEQRGVFANLAAEGLRALAEQLKAEADPRLIAQGLVLGGLQHQAFFQNLPLLTQDALAQREQAPGTVSSVDGVARELSATGVSHLGMALGGPLGEASARMVARQVFQAVDTLRAGEQLPLGALAGEVLGVPGLGLAPSTLSEVTSALAQLYAAQLASLDDDAGDLLAEFMPLLLQGEAEGLGAAWAALLGDAERMAALQAADAQTRAQVLRVLLVGGAVGVVPWEAVVPGLQAHGSSLFGLSLPPEMPPATAAEHYAASAARAVAVLGNDELCERLSAGELSPAQALAESQEHGARLFAGGTTPADPALTAALLGGLVPGK